MPAGTELAGTADWRACAYLKYWFYVCNDEHASFPGILTHEVGHNFGLLFSNDEVSYGDIRCFMGTSLNKADGPHV